jgi:hypothetical protein
LRGGAASRNNTIYTRDSLLSIVVVALTLSPALKCIPPTLQLLSLALQLIV